MSDTRARIYEVYLTRSESATVYVLAHSEAEADAIALDHEHLIYFDHDHTDADRTDELYDDDLDGLDSSVFASDGMSITSSEAIALVRQDPDAPPPRCKHTLELFGEAS